MKKLWAGLTVLTALVAAHPAAKRPRRFVLAALLVAMASAGFFSAAKGQAIVVVPSDTVRYFGPDRPLPWQSEELWSIGGMGVTLDSLTDIFFESLLLPWSVDTDSRGTIYIADDSRVYVVSSDGREVQSLGRAGEGPGEFPSSTIFGLDVSGDTLLNVKIPGAMVRWRVPGLTLVPRLRVGPVMVFRDFRVDGDSFFFTWVGRTVLDKAVRDTNRLFQYADGETSVVVEGSSHVKTVAGPSSRCFPGVMFSKLFAPVLHWDRQGGVLAIASDSLYAIHLVSDDEGGVLIERDLMPRRVTQEMAIREAALDDALSWGPPGAKCTTTPAEAVELWGHSEFLQPVGGLQLAPNGHVWALRGRVSDEPEVIDVFTADGEYLGTLEDVPMPVAFGPSGRIVTIDADELGVQAIKVHQLIGAQGPLW